MEEYSHESFQISGYKFRTSAKNAYKDISQAWDKINSEKLFEVLEKKAYPTLHNVYFNYSNVEDPEQKTYDVLIGYITEEGSVQSDNRLATVIILIQDYKYEHVIGQMPKDLIEAWEKVNSMSKEELPRTFEYDFDMYNDDGTECTLVVSVNKD
jgi:DNA polymerase III delta prime subunit